MEKPVLGIRIANGTYFPILGEDEVKKKKIILSPVKEDQKDVKIDIFRGDGDGMFNPSYVASLILNNITHDGGKPVEIELIIGINENRILDAEAYEPVSDNRQFLSISLDSIDEDAEFYDMPEMSDSDEPFLSASLEDEDFGNEDLETLKFEEEGESTEQEEFEGSDYSEEEDVSEADEEESSSSAAAFMYSDNTGGERKSNLLKAAVIILAIIFIILTALLIYTLLMKPALAKNGAAAEQPVPAASVQPPPPAPVQPEVKAEPAVPAAPVPPVVKAEPAAPVPAPAVPKEIRYRIKWGDTLWDISNSYYRTPWLYKKIARDNNIKNPDRIYAGRYLIIKEQ